MSATNAPGGAEPLAYVTAQLQISGCLRSAAAGAELSRQRFCRGDRYRCVDEPEDPPQVSIFGGDQLSRRC
jgi:hypothetical protein